LTFEPIADTLSARRILHLRIAVQL
jgi:hypothetical protein